MSIEQEQNFPITDEQIEVPAPVDRHLLVYPKPDKGQPEPVIRPDVDEETLGYN